MSASQQDEEVIESGLERLCELLGASVSADYPQVREYIDVHEFGLALDLLAYIQMSSGKSSDPETIRSFDVLARKMGMREGDRWRGVALIRAS